MFFECCTLGFLERTLDKMIEQTKRINNKSLQFQVRKEVVNFLFYDGTLSIHVFNIFFQTKMK